MGELFKMKTNLLKTGATPDLCPPVTPIECGTEGEIFNSSTLSNSVRVCLAAGEVAQLTAFKLAAGNTIKVFIDAKGNGVECADCGPDDRVPLLDCDGCHQNQLNEFKRQTYVVGPNCFVFVSDAPVGEPFVTMTKVHLDQVPPEFICQEPCYPPVTATVSICPLPSCFTWAGAKYESFVAFVNDVKSIVPNATYNPTTCTFTAPEGSVFPDLTVVACVPVVVPPVYCPSFRMDVCDCNEIGFAYRTGDSIDPAATVPILDCEGTAVGFGYPTPRVGATVPYTENNVVIGYLQNRSECAPEASAVINNYVTTNVAAPTVVLPAPTVASQTLDANDAIVTTLTNGTVFTTPLSNC